MLLIEPFGRHVSSMDIVQKACMKASMIALSQTPIRSGGVIYFKKNAGDHLFKKCGFILCLFHHYAKVEMKLKEFAWHYVHLLAQNGNDLSRDGA